MLDPKIYKQKWWFEQQHMGAQATRVGTHGQHGGSPQQRAKSCMKLGTLIQTWKGLQYQIISDYQLPSRAFHMSLLDPEKDSLGYGETLKVHRLNQWTNLAMVAQPDLAMEPWKDGKGLAIRSFNASNQLKHHDWHNPGYVFWDLRWYIYIYNVNTSLPKLNDCKKWSKGPAPSGSTAKYHELMDIMKDPAEDEAHQSRLGSGGYGSSRMENPKGSEPKTAGRTNHLLWQKQLWVGPGSKNKALVSTCSIVCIILLVYQA